MKIASDRILNNFIKRLILLYRPYIESITLFGSRAKAIAKPNSDFDILIVLKERSQEVINGIYDICTDILLDYGVDLSLKIYSKNNFDRMMEMKTPFMNEIIKTGITLWSKKRN